MIRHCSLWKFHDDVAEDLVDEITSEINAAVAEIPYVRGVSCGRNIGYLPTNYDLAMNLDFDDLDGYRAYVAHDRHMALYRQHLEPHTVNRVAVQFEL
jgi:hypothetical protein